MALMELYSELRGVMHLPYRITQYTVCPNTLRLHLLCLFSGVAWRLSSSGAHSHDILQLL